MQMPYLAVIVIKKGIMFMKMKLSLIIVFVLSAILLTSCGATSTIKGDPETVIDNYSETENGEYVVDIDNSFDAGIELEKPKEKLSPEEADFRNMKWGMTRDEVMGAEGTGFSEPSENVMYYTRVREEGYPANAEYTFVDDKLAQGIFFITHNKEDNIITLEDYHTLVNSLKARFGDPDMVQQHYYDESAKTDDTSKHIELIMANKLNYRTAWLLDDTELRVVMLKINDQLCIGLQYKDANAVIPKAE